MLMVFEGGLGSFIEVEEYDSQLVIGIERSDLASERVFLPIIIDSYIASIYSTRAVSFLFFVTYTFASTNGSRLFTQPRYTKPMRNSTSCSAKTSNNSKCTTIY